MTKTYKKRIYYIVGKDKKGYILFEASRERGYYCVRREIGYIKNNALPAHNIIKKRIQAGLYATDLAVYNHLNAPFDEQCIIKSYYPSELFPYVNINRWLQLSLIEDAAIDFDHVFVPKQYKTCRALAECLIQFGITDIHYDYGISPKVLEAYIKDTVTAFFSLCNILRIAPEDISLNGEFTSVVFSKRKSFHGKFLRGCTRFGYQLEFIVDPDSNKFDNREVAFHEWGHLLDHAVGITDYCDNEEIRSDAAEIITGRDSKGKKYREHLIEEDEKSEKQYLSLPCEIFASAFSIFIEDQCFLRSGNEYGMDRHTFRSNKSMQKLFQHLRKHKIFPLNK